MVDANPIASSRCSSSRIARATVFELCHAVTSRPRMSCLCTAFIPSSRVALLLLVDVEFVRALTDEDLIPTDVTIAVVTQARPELIERTFEAIDGARRAIVHLYNSTSVVQRRVVFGLGREGITDLAVGATALCRRLAAARATEIVFEYSPESFHQAGVLRDDQRPADTPLMAHPSGQPPSAARTPSAR